MPFDQPARILIVDDEAPQMKALCDTLRDCGYEPVGFTSGRDGLAALRSQPFDLLLVDLMMPEMDGISLLRAAQEIDANLVGIIMTGQGAIDTAVEAMKSGALDYILKPFRLSVILPVISRALGVRGLRVENSHLEKRVHQHALDLEAANRDLESFAFSVSHDLKAPVRVIGGYAQILMEDLGGALPERERGYLQHIVKSTTHLGNLIDGLLNLSRLGRQLLRKDQLDPTVLVQEVLAELRLQQEGPGTEAAVEVAVAALPGCIGDRALLKQVFTNLLSNAFKFTRGRAGPRIEVDAREENGETIYLVRDNGAGFDMRYADKLFGVFRRLHNHSEFEGTGIGLSIAHRIIQRHHGRIWAEGQVDQGATFYFTLGGAMPPGESTDGGKDSGSQPGP
jgi:two-component system sensor histidine kinase/response regulator